MTGERGHTGEESIDGVESKLQAAADEGFEWVDAIAAGDVTLVIMKRSRGSEGSTFSCGSAIRLRADYDGRTGSAASFTSTGSLPEVAGWGLGTHRFNLL